MEFYAHKDFEVDQELSLEGRTAELVLCLYQHLGQPDRVCRFSGWHSAFSRPRLGHPAAVPAAFGNDGGGGTSRVPADEVVWTNLGVPAGDASGGPGWSGFSLGDH